jgi:rhamnulokinase
MSYISKMKFVAIDLGASSGRVMLARFQNQNIQLEEIYRFPNGGMQTSHGFLWNYPKLFEDILKGLSIVSKNYGPDVDGMAVDSWGVDFVLLDVEEKPLSHFYHYRDERTINTYEKIYNLIPKEKIFDITGLQFMRINTICQLFESIRELRDSIETIEHFLMVPDYFTYLLSGKIINEFTDVSTTQLLDIRKRVWSKTILTALGIPTTIFHLLTYPGEKNGTLLPEIAEKTGLSSETPVFSTASHDTAAAVAAVPVDQEKYKPGEWAYLSSGTWSLLGVEMPEPILTEKVSHYNFTNEGGVFGTIRLLKNTTGFWILEECLKIWSQKNSKITWEVIIEEAQKSSITENYIDINHEDFVNPSQMIIKINKHYQGKYNMKLEGIGDISRVIFTSMVESYQNLLQNIEDITGISIRILHIVGGGSKNHYLNQLIANKLKIPVIAGPAEATTIGNVLMQILGTGAIKNLKEGREFIRKSFNLKNFNPVIQVDSK